MQDVRRGVGNNPGHEQDNTKWDTAGRQLGTGDAEDDVAGLK